MMSQDLKIITIEDWRELGFYYDKNDDLKEWIFIGSKEGILKFCNILKEYSEDKRNDNMGEHNHYGPYMYLKLMTWYSNGVNGDSIYGNLNEINNLSKIIIKKLATESEEFYIDDEYSEESTYKMKFIIQEDDFDPASSDCQLCYKNG